LRFLRAHALFAVLDDEGHHHARVVGGRHADEPAVVAVHLLGGAGLARHLHAVDGGVGAGAVVHHAHEHVAHAAGGRLADGLHELGGLGGEAALAVGVVDAVDEVGLHDGAVVGDGRSHERHFEHGG